MVEIPFFLLELPTYRKNKIYRVATIQYGLGTDDPEELGYYEKNKRKRDSNY